MSRLSQLLLALMLLLVSPLRAKMHDLVIYGGSSSGFAAAIQAARMGKTVALVEAGPHVGGINIEGLGGTDIDNHGSFQNSPAVGGLSLEFYKRLADHYGNREDFDTMLAGKQKNSKLWNFEPSAAQKVINTWLAELPIKIITNAPLVENENAVTKSQTADGPAISAITTDKGTFKGKVFIDATLEGDLLAAAGISTVIGREANSLYGETKNGIRHLTTHCQFGVKVDPYKTPGDPSSGTLPGVLDEALGEDGAGDHRLQAYCFRVCLTKNPENRIALPKPENYDRSNYELHFRYLRAGGKLYRPHAGLPNQKTDFNGGRDLSHNLNGMNHAYPAAGRKEREKIIQFHRDFTQGLFWFFANDPEVGKLAPEFQKEWAQWGLAKDEFTDNGGWPRIFYVRDARRLVSDYIITQHHVKKDNPTPVEDPVTMAFWPPDVHNVRTIVKDGSAWNEGFVFGGDDWIPFGVSYRALVPKTSECVNLLTSSCPSSSHIAYGAIRIEFTFMGMGQAAAAAACLAIDAGTSVQKVPYASLREQLLKDGQVLSLP